MSKFKVTEFGNSKTILKFADHYVNKPYTVSATGVTADADGRKIVKAGTVLPANDATAEGVLFYDVDVTHGDAAGALLIHGFVDSTKLDVQPSAEAKAALKQVTFL